MVHYRPPEGAVGRARVLRSNATDSEKRLWRLLRENFPDEHFRRQVPIRRFIADFASHHSKIVVEADGGQHGGADDVARTALIEAEGYLVLRFWNNEILGNPDGVLKAIASVVDGRSPHHEQVRIAPRSEAMPGGHGDLLILPIEGRALRPRPS